MQGYCSGCGRLLTIIAGEILPGGDGRQRVWRPVSHFAAGDFVECPGVRRNAGSWDFSEKPKPGRE